MYWRSTRARLRPGPSSSTRDGLPVATRAAGVAAALSRMPAGSSTTPRTSGATTAAVCRDAHRARRARRHPTSPPSASPTSARPALVWDRATGEPLDSAIVWQDRRTAELCARARRRGARAAGHRADRAAPRPLLLRHQARVAPRPRAGRPRARRERGELALRHRRQLPDLAADRRRGARDRRHQRRRGRCSTTSTTGAGTTNFCDCSTSRARCCPRCTDCSRRLRHDARRTSSARPMPIPGIAGDQQAATVGPGLLRARHAQERPTAPAASPCSTPATTPVARAEPAADHHRLPARRQAHLRARRLDLRRRRRRAVAARRPRVIARRGRDRARSPTTPPDTSGSTSSPPSPASARPTGTPTPRRIFGLTRDTGIGRDRPRRPRSGRLPDPRPDGSMAADGGAQPKRAPRRWRHGRERLADAVLSRHPGVAGRATNVTETTALGAAYLAGLHTGVYASLDSVAAAWQRERLFDPDMKPSDRARLYEGWQRAVRRVRSDMA